MRSPVVPPVSDSLAEIGDLHLQLMAALVDDLQVLPAT